MSSKLGIKDMVRVADAAVNNPRGTHGSPDLDATDYLEVAGNDTAREITLTAKNDDESAALPLCLGSILKLSVFASVSALNTAYPVEDHYGSIAMVNVSGTYKLYVASSGSSTWVLAASQS